MAKTEEDFRKVAHQIIGEFEFLLDEKGIKIPSESREDSEKPDEDACIYGVEYYRLEDSILNILQDNFLKGGK